ncbi:hypothetical protein KIN20_011474 [Parelaphostrongylus tenuis]|uniref:Uncharacterized protein n=1 Tax=Parelaphostrongylus tenuis TaxID=148309 RepID=A0AAD5MCX4_PARTN|nr:hypothetical protein KIN20_011474 [Parelaphostrongylus tenuis]
MESTGSEAFGGIFGSIVALTVVAYAPASSCGEDKVKVFHMDSKEFSLEHHAFVKSHRLYNLKQKLSS